MPAKPIIFTTEDYFKQMIDYEKNEKNPGSTERVKGLEIMLDHAKLISNSQNLMYLFPQYKEFIKELTTTEKEPSKNESESSNKKICSIF